MHLARLEGDGLGEGEGQQHDQGHAPQGPRQAGFEPAQVGHEEPEPQRDTHGQGDASRDEAHWREAAGPRGPDGKSDDR